MVTETEKYIAIPPGETIGDLIESRGIAQEDFAELMEMSEEDMKKLLKGEISLTTDIADELEVITRMPAKFWNELESIY